MPVTQAAKRRKMAGGRGVGGGAGAAGGGGGGGGAGGGGGGGQEGAQRGRIAFGTGACHTSLTVAGGRFARFWHTLTSSQTAQT